MPNGDQPNEISPMQAAQAALIAGFAQNPPAFALVTGVGIGQRPDIEGDAPQYLLIFVEPAPECELLALWRRIEALHTPQFLFLRTGRFIGLQRTVGQVGDSIGVYAPDRYNVPPVNAGTLGALVDAPGKHYILGSNHAMAFNGRAAGADVVAPGTVDDRTGGVVVGHVSQVVELLPPAWPQWTPTPNPPNPLAATKPCPQPNPVDCALAEITPAGSRLAGTPPSLTVAQPAGRGVTPVKKKGRSTGATSSLVRIWNVSAFIDLSFGTYYFTELMCAYGVTNAANAFASHGDSGSMVVTDPGNQGLGLIMARAYCGGVYAPAGVTFQPPLVPKSFKGYLVLLCSLVAVRRELAKKLGTPPGIPQNQVGFRY